MSWSIYCCLKAVFWPIKIHGVREAMGNHPEDVDSRTPLCLIPMMVLWRASPHGSLPALFVGGSSCTVDERVYF